MVEYVRGIWARREYITTIPINELKAENYDTVLGNLWHLLNPLLLMLVYYVAFGIGLRSGRGIDNFITFLAIGLFVFRFTQKSAMKGSKSIVNNERLIRSLYFPRAILPVSAVFGQLLAFLPELLTLVAISVVTGVDPQVTWFILAPMIGVQIFMNLGLAFLAARITDRFVDFQNMLPFGFRLMFYMSGILFSVEQRVESEALLRLFEWNPIYAMVTIARGAIFGDPVSATLWVSFVAWSAFFFVLGFFVFKAGEQTYGRA